MLSFENTLNEKEKLNIGVIEAFSLANIPLEKIEKLKPFLLKHCKNGMKLYLYFNFLIFLLLIIIYL